MEQIVIRNLPPGTKARLKARAKRHRRSAEAEARAILADSLSQAPATLVDLLATDHGTDVDLETERLHATARTADL